MISIQSIGCGFEPYIGFTFYLVGHIFKNSFWGKMVHILKFKAINFNRFWYHLIFIIVNIDKSSIQNNQRQSCQQRSITLPMPMFPFNLFRSSSEKTLLTNPMPFLRWYLQSFVPKLVTIPALSWPLEGYSIQNENMFKYNCIQVLQIYWSVHKEL